MGTALIIEIIEGGVRLALLVDIVVVHVFMYPHASLPKCLHSLRLPSSQPAHMDLGSSQ
jgi:hypothetical protein